MRLKDRLKLKALRGLCPPQANARKRSGDAAASVLAFQRIDDRDRGDGSGLLVQRAEHPANNIGSHVRPRRVVDQDVIGSVCGKGFEAGEDAGLPFRTTGHWRKQFAVQSGGRLVVGGALALTDDDLNDADTRMLSKGLDGQRHHRAAVDGLILLRHAANLGACALASGNDEGSSEHSRRS